MASRGGAQGFAPLPLGLALAGFLLGALFAGMAANRHKGQPLRLRMINAAIAESLRISAAALVDLYFGTAVMSGVPL